jgi:hypothetical protein
MHTSKSVRSLLSGIAAVGVVTILPGRARAEEIFPGVIAQAANMPCAPTCTLCHTTNPGEKGTWVGKKFGYYMGTHGAVMGDKNSIITAFNAYKADPSSGPALAALQQGLDPDNGTSLCGPTYGCGAHVAKQAPPSDLSAPLWVVGAMVFGGLLRRRKPAARS